MARSGPFVHPETGEVENCGPHVMRRLARSANGMQSASERALILIDCTMELMMRAQ